LSVDDKQLGDGVLEAAARFDGGADSVDPLSRNGLDALFAVDHEGEYVERMSGSLDTMAAWLSATPMGQHQGAGESVSGNAEARQEPPLAALQGGGIEPHRRIRRSHLIVIIHSAIRKNKPNLKCFIELEERRRIKA
jgi:hypothetical protein